MRSTVQERTGTTDIAGEGASGNDTAEEAQRKYAEHVLLSAMRAAKGFRTELLKGGDMGAFVAGATGQHGGLGTAVGTESGSIMSEIEDEIIQVPFHDPYLPPSYLVTL